MLEGQVRQLFPKTRKPARVLICWNIPLAIMNNGGSPLFCEALSVGLNCMWEADRQFCLDDCKGGAFTLMINYLPGSSKTNAEIEARCKTK